MRSAWNCVNRQTTLTEKIGVDARNYAPHGGCFPIKLPGTGCIGTITVSGLPQRIDHELIVEVLAEILGQPLAELALAANRTTQSNSGASISHLGHPPGKFWSFFTTYARTRQPAFRLLAFGHESSGHRRRGFHRLALG